MSEQCEQCDLAHPDLSLAVYPGCCKSMVPLLLLPLNFLLSLFVGSCFCFGDRMSVKPKLALN